jgi:squalene-hopene/tetraprenyl-beta-curcumene cyclase
LETGPIRNASAARLQKAAQAGRGTLLAMRSPEGVWTGELSASALSTATALAALSLAQAQAPRLHFADLIERGFSWLAANANADGGWGDTVLSSSNISTTILVWAALGLRPAGRENLDRAAADAERWVAARVGSLAPDNLAAHVIDRYGKDRTFSAPILTHCALTGRLGPGPAAWRNVIPLPFELAACPPEWFAALRLPVVSYALPALIAVGYARHFHSPSRNPLVRALRNLSSDRAFRVLDRIQPPKGGFLEAIPLTSFVSMSLAGSGKLDHPVARRGLEFIVNSAQADGSWRIDTNLSTWVTSLAVHALGSGGETALPASERAAISRWLRDQQYRSRHPYTNAAPGGWAWTNLPGGVPDADDTPGALLALMTLGGNDPNSLAAATAGVTWLLDLQNRDGGIPTFCRGWGNLPFDRSSPDLTAHALRAWSVWRPNLPDSLRSRLDRAIARATAFLRRTQEPDGPWAPLWFGNEHEPDESNRVYGTSRALLALADTGLAPDCAARAADWLLRAQKPDGGWSGGLAPSPASVEETALAVESLAAVIHRDPATRPHIEAGLRRGVEWLVVRVEDGSWTSPTPIGFYFAKLWYYERLYPVVYATAALARVAAVGVAI